MGPTGVLRAELVADWERPLLGVKRTWRGLVTLSANDPKRTFDGSLADHPPKGTSLGITCLRTSGPMEISPEKGRP